MGRVLTFFVTVVTFAETKHIPNPAPPGSSQAYLVAGPEGKVYLSWIEPAKAGRSRLRFAVRNNVDWHLLGTISEGANWFVNWADYPTLLPMREGVFAAHWLEKKGHSTYSYGDGPVRCRRSILEDLVCPRSPPGRAIHRVRFACNSIKRTGCRVPCAHPGRGRTRQSASIRAVRVRRCRNL